MIADVIALNPCAKLPQKSTSSRTFLGIYKINVKISVKNDPNTKLLALEQLAKDYNLSNAASKIIEKFVTLKPEKRKELLDLFLEIAKVLEESDIDTSTPAIPENQFPNFSQDSLIETIRQNVPKTPEELEKRFPPVEPRSNTNTG